MEIITIRTHISKGADIMIYKIINNILAEFACIEEKGTPHRWLYIAAVYDLDGDGIVELAWIQTPHIGGILKLAKIVASELNTSTEFSNYSNHAIEKKIYASQW